MITTTIVLGKGNAILKFVRDIEERDDKDLYTRPKVVGTRCVDSFSFCLDLQNYEFLRKGRENTEEENQDSF